MTGKAGFERGAPFGGVSNPQIRQVSAQHVDGMASARVGRDARRHGPRSLFRRAAVDDSKVDRERPEEETNRTIADASACN